MSAEEEVTTKAVINVPILDEYNEVEMLTSDRFFKAKHTIRTLTIYNHKTTNTRRKERKSLPAGISLDPQTKFYSITKWNWVDIRMTFKRIDPHVGLEELNYFLKSEYPKEEFYVSKMLTETVVDKVRHVCTWKRKSSSAIQGSVLSLQLIFIDGKKAIEKFTSEEMKHIVGNLSSDVCRISFRTNLKPVPLCDPVPVATKKKK